MFGATEAKNRSTIKAFEQIPTPRAGKELPPEVPAVARRMWPDLLRVDAVDKYTVRFYNATPDVTLEGRLSRYGSNITSRRAWDEAASYLDWARKPVTTGPYKVVELRPDVSLTLEAHDEYWGGRPPLKRIRFVEVPEVASRINGLLSGEYQFACDIPPDQIASIEKNAAFEVQGGTISNHRLTVFDKNHAQLANPLVRRAFTHAIDRQAIVDSLWAGRTRVPKGLQWEFYADMFQADWNVPEFNPKLAQDLLKQANYKGDPIPYRLLNNYYTNQVATAQVLVEMWKSRRAERPDRDQGKLDADLGAQRRARRARLVEFRRLQRSGLVAGRPAWSAGPAAAGRRVDQRRAEPALGVPRNLDRSGRAPEGLPPDARDRRARRPGLHRAAPERDVHGEAEGHQVEGVAGLRHGFPPRQLRSLTMPPLLAIENLTVSFGETRVLHGVDFTVGKGEALGLVGESGSGKSVTWLAALGLLPGTARSRAG